MIAAHRPNQRPLDAKLLVVDAHGRIMHAPRSRFVDFLRPGDLVVANDAATLPASLQGVHLPSGAAIEVRLAGWHVRRGLPARDVHMFQAVVFGAGDFRTRTEDRPLPPRLGLGDNLLLGDAGRVLSDVGRIVSHVGRVPWAPADGPPAKQDPPHSRNSGAEPLVATIVARLGHPRLVLLRFEGSSSVVWEGLARHGRPIQYAHVPDALAMWDVWTPIAGVPVAFESPSAGFVLDWRAIRAMRERGIGFATVTLAAGISSTGDTDLDRRLPFDEPYRIPESTASAIRRAQADGGRIVAIGTTVVRALEHAGRVDGFVTPGDGIADQRLGPTSRLRIVDAILSGTHEPDSSHYQLLRAFTDDETMAEASAAVEAAGYQTHEFGDSVLIERQEDESGPSTTINAELAELADRCEAVPVSAISACSALIVVPGSC